MMDACQGDRRKALRQHVDLLLAMRENDERRSVETSQLAGFALAAVHWRIPLNQAATGHVWSGLENQVLAGIKSIPLGQTEGHRILGGMDSAVIKAVASDLDLKDNDMGTACPALAIASSRHETQYTRRYRS